MVPVREIVENGVDKNRFSADILSRGERNEIIFAFVGRLVDWKAVDILLEALALISCKTKITFEIFGDGDERPALESLVEKLGLKERVVFHGFVSQEKVAERLSQLDGLVLSSLFECGGAVVLEAMALGLPVISTKWGGPVDYLDERCGILIDPGSRAALVQGFAESMQYLAENPKIRQQMGLNGRQKIDAKFDWEAKVDAILEVYDAVAATNQH